MPFDPAVAEAVKAKYPNLSLAVEANGPDPVLAGAELNSEIEHASPYGKAPGQKNAQGKLMLGTRAKRAYEKLQAAARTSEAPPSQATPRILAARCVPARQFDTPRVDLMTPRRSSPSKRLIFLQRAVVHALDSVTPQITWATCAHGTNTAQLPGPGGRTAAFLRCANLRGSAAVYLPADRPRRYRVAPGASADGRRGQGLYERLSDP